MMKLPQTTLVVPLSTGPKTSYKRNTKKPDSEKSILELFFDAQYDIQSGVQPPICIRNGILIEHLGQRVRAPTTWETIQDGINKKSDVHKRAQEIETGDFSDDEEDDELSSRQYPPSPRSNGHGHGHTPPPPSPHEEESQSHTFSTTTSPRGGFAKPQPKGRKGTGKSKRRGKISLDERVDGSVSNTTNSFMNSHKSSESSYNNSNNSNSNNNNNPNKQYSKIPENSMSNHPNNNNNNSNSNYNGNGNSNNNENSSNGVDTSTHKHKKLHSPRRRQKPQSQQSVHDLWFKAQRELAEGRQPRICKQNGVRLENVRIHVAKYANHAKRNSRVSPQDFLNTYNISKPRKSIAADDDEDEDLTADEGDPEFSNSKSINSSKKVII